MSRDSAPTDLAAVEIDIPDSVEIEHVPVSKLPPGWDAFPASAFTRQLGTDWIAARRTAILEVPSAIIHHERNYLLNPAHPRLGRVRVIGHAPFTFDTRLMA
jgi:RES domain-containing protein